MLKFVFNNYASMIKLNYRVPTKVIRSANSRLIANGVDHVSYNGIITIRYFLNGVEKVKEFSKAEINNAFRKALETYGKKL